MPDQRNGDRSHTARGGIRLMPRSKLLADSVVNRSVLRQPGVRGPHPLERLAHRAEYC